MWPQAALVVGGSLLSAKSKLEAGKVDAANMRQQAQLLDFSADRVIRLNDLNTKETERRKYATQDTAKVLAASGGLDAPQEVLAQVTQDAMREIQINTEAAKFEETKYRLQADQLRKNAKATEKAAKWGAVTSLVSGGGQLAAIK